MRSKTSYFCEYCGEEFKDTEYADAKSVCLEHEKYCKDYEIETLKAKINFHKTKSCYSCRYFDYSHETHSLGCTRYKEFGLKCDMITICDDWKARLVSTQVK